MSFEAFDPFTQTFTILMADGVTPIEVSVADLDTFGFYNSKVLANYGAQLGATMIMLVVILLITKEGKRKTLVFALNVLALVLSITRTILNMAYWTGPFTRTYAYISGDYSAVPFSSYVSSITASVMVLLFLWVVELSLLLQVHILFKGLQSRLQHTIMILFSTLVVLLCVGFRFAAVVLNSEYTLSLDETYNIIWIASASLIMETVTIWYFCLIFMGKLIYHIMRQRQMNAVVFRPLQILSIMSGCTMIIPSIFAILEYFPSQTFPEAGSIALTLVAIMLPLSSTWASASIEDPKPLNLLASSQPPGSYSTGHTVLHGSAYDRKGSIGMTNFSTSATATVENDGVGGGGGKGFVGKNYKTSTLGSGGGGGGSDLDDIDESRVLVEKSYSVRSGPGGSGGGGAGGKY